MSETEKNRALYIPLNWNILSSLHTQKNNKKGNNSDWDIRLFYYLFGPFRVHPKSMEVSKMISIMRLCVEDFLCSDLDLLQCLDEFRIGAHGSLEIVTLTVKIGTAILVHVTCRVRNLWMLLGCQKWAIIWFMWGSLPYVNVLHHQLL